MATIELKDGNLVVQIHGWDVVLALRSSLTIPLAHIKGVVANPPDAAYDDVKGIRLAGGYFPKSFAAGYFWVTGGTAHAGQQHALEQLTTALKDLEGLDDTPAFRASEVRAHIEAGAEGLRRALHEAGAPELSKYLAFYDVHKPEKAIGLDVEHGRLRRVVVEIEDESPDDCAARIRAALDAS